LMQSHGPKRFYTPQSLEFWFGKLSEEWSGAFTAAQLDEGRRIYREQEVRELELTDKDAIVHRRIEKKDEYAVIEWGTAGLTVRSSTTDRDLAHALAVAGLHEIEELVADEISPLPDMLFGGNSRDIQNNGSRLIEGTRQPAHGGEPHGTNGGGNGNSNSLGQGNGSHRASVPSNGSGIHPPSRALVLAFKTKSAGLTFQAVWLEYDRKTRVPALGPGAHANASNHMSSAERAKLIGLAAYARKAHFHYDQETGVYLMESLVEIPNFLRSTLAGWKRIFTIELDDKAANLVKGTRAIEIEAVAEGNFPGSAGRGAGSGLNLRWIFRAGERLLTDAEVHALLKRGGQPVILPSLGIVSLPADRWDSYCSWQKNLTETAEGSAVPPYLIFSLFNDARLKVTLSPEVESWRQTVLTPPSTAPELGDWLRPYQRRGVEWLHHLCEVGCHGLLADEMGLGKTVQVLSLLASRPAEDRPSVIVCPASVVPVWREEIAKFFPQLAVEVLKAGHDFTHNPAPIIWLASYTQLRKHRSLLDAAEFSYAVLDEGQFIKNPDAKVTQTCFAVRARHRIVLTGTPLENRQLDLWSIFRFLLPGLLGSRSGFEAALNADRDGTLGRLRAQLAPFILRRTKKEVATELPPKVEMDLPVDRCAARGVRPNLHRGPGPAGRRRRGGDAGKIVRVFGAADPAAPDVLRSRHAALAACALVRLGQDQPARRKTGRGGGQRAQGRDFLAVCAAPQPRARSALAAFPGVAALRADRHDARPPKARARFPDGQRSGGDARVA
jgi:hypothetical protein